MNNFKDWNNGISWTVWIYAKSWTYIDATNYNAFLFVSNHAVGGRFAWVSFLINNKAKSQIPKHNPTTPSRRQHDFKKQIIPLIVFYHNSSWCLSAMKRLKHLRSRNFNMCAAWGICHPASSGSRASIGRRAPANRHRPEKNKKGSEYAEFNKTNKKTKSKSTFLDRVQPSFLTESNRVQTPLNRV